jgi:transposase
MTPDLLQLREWLQSEGVTHVAMESTGVYWKPVFNLLEDQGMELMVVNARHVKAVPGRKTDVKDAEWLADLLRHGLLKASFIPNREQRELRELVRYRRTVIEQRAHVVQRIQKLLEGANIKLGDVTSDVMGVSGRAMLTALAAADQDARTLAGMAKTALRRKIPELERALTGSFGPHQRFMLRSQFQLLEALEAQIASLDDEVAQRMRPLQAALDHLDEIPGIGVRAAQQIIAEVGTDMTRFPTSAHFASWARICPVITSPRVSVGTAPSAVATAGCATLCLKQLGQSATLAGRPSSPLAIVESQPVAATSARPSPALTPFSSPSITCCATAPSSRILAQCTSRSSTARQSPAAVSDA